MKARLERLIERITELRDQAHDDEFTDELDNALIHLDAASDRLVAIEEESDEESEAPISDRYCPHCGDNHI